MKRREFITLLGSAAAVWPVAASGQQGSAMRRIAVLMNLTESEAAAEGSAATFRQRACKSWAR